MVSPPASGTAADVTVHINVIVGLRFVSFAANSAVLQRALSSAWGFRMNWIEYVRVLDEFRARFGRMPPSILTEDGALDHMRAALDNAAADGDGDGGQPRAS